MHLSQRSHIFLLFLVLCLTSYESNAQWKTYNTIVGGWDVAANWTPAGIPSATDSVMINKIVLIPAGLDAFAQKVHVGLGGVLNISDNVGPTPRGRLLIEDSPNSGLIIEGRLVCDGVVKIVNTQDKGAVNYGEIEISVGGKFQIDSTTIGRGIENYGMISNSGLLISHKVNDHAILNNDTLFNMPTGVIEISATDGSGVAGIKNDSMSYFHNQGAVEIDSDEGTGILNYGELVNQDTITISNVKRSGIRNYNICTNLSTGYIHIFKHCNCSEFGGVSSVTYSGIANMDGRFSNYGNMLIDDVAYNRGFYNDAYVLNTGEMHIRDTNLSSFDNQDTLINGEDGLILIEKISSPLGAPPNEALRTDGYLANHGMINILDGAVKACRNKGTIHNLGSLSILDAEDTGLINDGNIYNYQGGSIVISSVSDSLSTGLTLTHSADTLINEGDISIMSVGGTAIRNLGYIENNDRLTITNTPSGILLGTTFVTDDYFINNGILDIKNVEQIGMDMFGTFINEPDGSILIEHNNTAIPFTVYIGALFDNFGDLDVRPD